MPDDYATHYPILAAVVAKVCGNVLELGCGEGSTPMLHYMCKAMKCPLYTYESDPVWLARYRAYAVPEHWMFHARDWAEWMNMQDEVYLNRKWGVAFVDCAPGEMRAPLIAWLKGKARFIVTHDTETDYATGANYKYEPVFGLFKYRAEFRRWRPYTTVLSDDEPFEIDECDRVWVPSEVQATYFKEMGITG
jgi:hypothetical protein